MRSDQNAPPPNEGINMLPGYSGDMGYNPEDMQPLTRSNVDFSPGQQGPGIVTNTFAPPPAQSFGGPEPGAPRAIPNYPVPGGYPALGNGGDWRNNATSGLTGFRDNAIKEQPGFFARLLQSITGGLSGVGDMFDNLHGQPARSAPSGGMLMSDRTFNSYRGAFSPTYQQLSGSPGSSMIGPTSGLVSNPYKGKVIGGGDHSTRAPGYAQAFSNVVKARNIA